jgi:tetratricopeptide (TPR) repeat protein
MRQGSVRPDREVVLAAALTVALSVIYAAGACPTIYVGDSGELVAAVYVLGIPHPTGYPLYILLGKLWTVLLPVGSIAYRMSLFSAFWAAVACGVLYRLCRGLDLHPLAALVAALLLAFSPSFWGEANVQRVYSLNAVFVALATAAAFGWYRRRKPWLLVLAFFVCGLGAANHTFMAVYALALAVWVMLVGGFRRVAAATGAFAIGLLPYLYLPVRSRMNPPLDWGNPETLQGFLGVVLRRGFWERAWIESPSDLVTIAIDYVRSLGVELAWAGSGLAVLGIIASLASRQRRGLVLLPLLVMAANLAALAAHGSRSDIFIWHRYYIPSYAMAALLAGLGCDLLLAHLPRPLAVLPLLIPAFLLVSGWRECDRSRYRIAEDFAHAVLTSVPPGAHLIATDDNILFVLIYLQMVEHQRPDVDLILQGVGGADLPPLRFNPETEPLFFTHHPNWNLPALEIVPIGVVLQARRPGQLLPSPVLPVLRLEGEDDPDVPKDYLTKNLIGHFHYMLGFTFEERDWLRARREFATAAAASPDNDVLFYNLGLIFRRNGLADDAIDSFQASHAINPRHLASLTAPRTADRIEELLAEQQRLAKNEAVLATTPALAAATRGTPAYHRRLAELLEARGEPVAARGHRLQALELEAGFVAPRLSR